MFFAVFQGIPLEPLGVTIQSLTPPFPSLIIWWGARFIWWFTCRDPGLESFFKIAYVFQLNVWLQLEHSDRYSTRTWLWKNAKELAFQVRKPWRPETKHEHALNIKVFVCLSELSEPFQGLVLAKRQLRSGDDSRGRRILDMAKRLNPDMHGLSRDVTRLYILSFLSSMVGTPVARKCLRYWDIMRPPVNLWHQPSEDKMR